MISSTHTLIQRYNELIEHVYVYVYAYMCMYVCIYAYIYIYIAFPTLSIESPEYRNSL